jgi:hypothetical protein
MTEQSGSGSSSSTSTQGQNWNTPFSQLQSKVGTGTTDYILIAKQGDNYSLYSNKNESEGKTFLEGIGGKLETIFGKESVTS